MSRITSWQSGWHGSLIVVVGRRRVNRRARDVDAGRLTLALSKMFAATRSGVYETKPVAASRGTSVLSCTIRMLAVNEGKSWLVGGTFGGARRSRDGSGISETPKYFPKFDEFEAEACPRID